MADSAKESKVEDVLSSVRRLVSEEVPRTERAPVPPGLGALVLTESDRVQKNDGPAKANDRSLEQRIAELEAAVDRGGQEFEPDGSEDQTMNIPDRIVYTRPPSSEEEAKMRGTLRLSEIALIKTAPTDETVDEPESEPVTDPVASAPFRTVSRDRVRSRSLTDLTDPGVEAPMAEDVPTEPAKKATVTAFTSPDEVVERIDERTRQVSRPSPQYETMPASPPSAVPSDENADAKSKDDFDAALMAAVKASVKDVVQSELAATLPEPEPTPEPEPDPKPNPVSDPPASAEAETTTAALPVSDDNAALRNLVSELIRDELQGELGERITRNVRKLVRREIKRALASDDLL